MGSGDFDFAAEEKKLQQEMDELDKRRKTLMTQLGEALYDRVRTSALRTGNERLFGDIEKVDEQRESLHARLDKLKEDQQAQSAAASDTPSCPRCHMPLEPGAAFCINCGCRIEAAEVVRVCPKCGNRVSNEDIFCIKCGTKLGTAVQAAPEPPAPVVEPEVQPDDELKCPSCGALVEEGDLFCIECGAKLDEVFATQVLPKLKHNATSEPVRSMGSVPEIPEVEQYKEPEPVPVSIPAHVSPEKWSGRDNKGTIIDVPTPQAKPTRTPSAPDVVTVENAGYIPAAKPTPEAMQKPAARRIVSTPTIRCPRCGAPAASSDRYCAICAAALPR